MSRNLESLTKLTEFEPIQTEERPQTVSQFFANLFKIGKESEGSDSKSLGEGSLDTVQESLPKWAIDSETASVQSDNVSNVYTVDVSEGRSLPNVLKRISNLLVLKSNNLQAYSDSELKTYWMPDSVSKECYECCEKFTTFRRRHHCRVCGQIFCSSCCNQQIPGKIFGCTGDLRVCTYCSKVVLSYLQSSDISSDLTADLKILQENLQSKYGPAISGQQSSVNVNQSSLSPSNLRANSGENSGTIKRKISVGYQEEKFSAGRQASVTYLTPQEKCKALQNSSSLRNLYEELLKPSGSGGLPLRSHWYRLRAYHDCVLGSEIVDWLINQQKANTRVQASAICQALLDGGYLESLSESETFIDGYAFYKPGVVLSPEPITETEPEEAVNPDEPSWIQNIPQESTSATDSDNEPLSLRLQSRIPSSTSYTLDLNIGASTVYLCRPPNAHEVPTPQSESDCEAERNITTCSDSFVRTSEHREIVPESGWHNATILRVENSEKSTYDILTNTFKQHKQSLLQQLLSVNGLSLHWSTIISILCDEAINIVRPDMNHDAVELDIRHYVQFKKVAGGKRSDCQLINGVVCSKNIAHKGMATFLDNPKILLLEGSIVYQRTEGRLTSLEPVLMQEHEYLRHVANRIIALQPDLVLVQRNVSRLAQDILRDQGVTLVLNVKQRILERVARCTEADIVTSVDSCIGRPRLGTCKRFYLKSFDTERDCIKNLMIFEGLAMPHLGATVLLRGASKLELVRLKKVAALILFACYNWRLEKSFLMDEMARPPNFRTEFFVDSRENSPIQQIQTIDTFNEKSLKPNSDNLRKQESTTSESDTSLFTTTKFLVDDESIKPKIFCENLEKKISNSACSESVQDFTDPLQSSENIEVIIEKLSVAELPFSNKFRESLEDTILSVSPYLLYSVPYLETELGRKCELRSFFPNQIYHSEQFDNNKRSKSFKENDYIDILKNNTKLNPVHPFVTAQIGNNINSCEIQTMLAHYRAYGGRFLRKSMIKSNVSETDSDSKTKSKNKASYDNQMDVLDPNNHQRLAVLFCSFSHQSNNAPAFCVNPWVIYMDFYNRDDIPLGCFLERYCFNNSYHCQSRGCDTPMLHHIRRFVHGNGCVSLSLNTYPSKLAAAMDDRHRIVMWTWCTRCQLAGPIVPMSTDTWSFSFAKYLQLRFIGGAYSRRGSAQCGHSLHHDQYQYFGYNDMVACFTYTPIQLWEISLPPATISFKFHTLKLQSQLIDEIKSTAIKGHEIYSIISEKINLLPEIEAVTNWKQILVKEQIVFKQRIEEVQIKLTSPTIEKRDLVDFDNENSLVHSSIWKISDNVIGIKQIIIEMVEKWNARLQDMGKLREIELKKIKNQPQDLEISIETNKPGSVLINPENDPNIAKSEVGISSAALPKKIRSLDQSEEDVVPIKSHHRSSSDGTVLTQLEEMADNKDKKDEKRSSKSDKKNIFSQLLTSTTAFSPINCPYSPLGHFTLPAGIYASIVVYETELSSMIAYALNSHEYLKALDELRLVKTPQTINQSTNSSPVSVNHEETPSPVHKRRSQSDNKSRSESTNTDSGLLSFLRANNSKNDLSTMANCSVSSDSSQGTIGSDQEIVVAAKDTINKGDDKESTKKPQQNHVDIQFEDASCKFFCRVYCAEEFARLRTINVKVSEEEYIRSLARCFQWNARGGKSGSTFSKTLDERFILKDMSKSDINLFLEWAPNYFAYMDRCHNTTLLGKILGMYHLIFKNSATNATLRTNVLVMENLFYNRGVSQKFDLKGSERNRLVNPDNQDGEIVLLDENFLKRTCESPLYILPHSKAVLIAAIQNDTEFLVEQSVMDYSLLVGLDTNNKELVLGIIDYIRTFTWDKKLETMFKKYGMLGGQGKLPTIISPQEYRNRFIEAMHRYFLQVPDSWAGLGKGLES